MKQIVIYSLMVQKFTNSKQKFPHQATPSCLGIISKDLSVDNIKKTGFNGHVHDFSVDFDETAVDDILGIQKYLMRKNNIV